MENLKVENKRETIKKIFSDKNFWKYNEWF